MSRPILQIEPGPIDKAFLWCTYIGLIILVILPCIYFSKLPKKIPIHFGVDGTPDSFGHKSTLFLLPAIGLIICSLFNRLSKVPHTFNYPFPIHAGNAHDQYSNAIKMMRILNIAIVWGFAYITYQIIQNGLEKSQGLGPYFLIIFMTLLLGPIFYFTTKSFQNK